MHWFLSANVRSHWSFDGASDSVSPYSLGGYAPSLKKDHGAALFLLWIQLRKGVVT